MTDSTNLPKPVNALTSNSDEHIPETFKMFAPAVSIAVGNLLSVPVKKSPILSFILGVVVQILNTALAT